MPLGSPKLQKTLAPGTRSIVVTRFHCDKPGSVRNVKFSLRPFNSPRILRALCGSAVSVWVPTRSPNVLWSASSPLSRRARRGYARVECSTRFRNK